MRDVGSPYGSGVARAKTNAGRKKTRGTSVKSPAGPCISPENLWDALIHAPSRAWMQRSLEEMPLRWMVAIALLTDRHRFGRGQ